MLDLAQSHAMQASDVESIEVSIGKTQKAILHADQPTTGLEAKFSIQFAMACALLLRRVTLSELVDPVVQRADVQALMKRVSVTLITEYDAVMPQYAPYDQVAVRLKSKQVLESGRITRAKGHINRPLSEAELFAKFASCLAFAGSSLDARTLFGSLNQLDRQPAGWLRHPLSGSTARGTEHAAPSGKPR
jgi:2-methylcitrate dehydratase PrpD